MSRYTKDKAKEEVDMNLLPSKKVINRSEFMVFYDVSYEWITEKIKEGMPCMNGGSKFHKELIDKWFMRLAG